jgi:hypothetical protein
VPYRLLVDAALSAPTGENCQPFTFRREGDALLVCHDGDRARHRLNPREHASLISLGCLLEAVELRAGRLGLGMELDELDVGSGEPRDGGAGAPWARLRFPARGNGSGSDSDAATLEAALPQRATDRRPFRPGAVPEALRTALLLDARRFSDCRLILRGPATGALRELILESDSLLWSDPAVARDAIRWVRFSDAELLRTRDGLNWRNLGYPIGIGQLSRVVRGGPGALRLLRAAGGAVASRALLARLVDSATLTGLVAVRGTGRQRLVEAGRLSMRAWLRLTAAGWGFQPLTLPSLCVYNATVGALPLDLPASARALLLGGEPVLREAFELGARELPLWMFRAGPSEPLPANLRVPRRRVDEVLRA